MTLEDFSREVRERTDAFLGRTLARLDGTAAELQEALRYGLLLGGKRARPVLVQAAGQMLGASAEVLDYPAAAVECIHAYSLIHDDMPEMDNDRMRRGQPCVHVRFGADLALLAGDALQAMAFELLSDRGSPLGDELRVTLTALLSGAAGCRGMCGGQALDLMGGRRQMTLSDLQELHRRKTGALITASVLMGAHCSARVNPGILEALGEYAACTGLAFQVWDDVLDVIGDSAVTGKSTGADAALGKSTYPSLLGLEMARDHARQLCERAVAALEGLPADSRLLQDFARYAVSRDR